MKVFVFDLLALFIVVVLKIDGAYSHATSHPKDFIHLTQPSRCERIAGAVSW